MVMVRTSVSHEPTSAMHPIGRRAAAFALSLLAIAVMVNTARYLGSTALGVFWALTVAYTVGMIGYGERRSVAGRGARRVTLPLLSAGTAVGVLAWTVAGWGRTWPAIAVALAAGLGVHAIVRALWRTHDNG
jgi:hypothetical protein